MVKKFNNHAKIVLADGTSIPGIAFGAEKSVAGEFVFNTGMVGYPESLTDPSYTGQILVMTYPLVGNYGVPVAAKDRWGIQKNFESEKMRIRGLVVDELCDWFFSHYAAEKSLRGWLYDQGVVGIMGIDTRALTKHLREKGVMIGRIEVGGRKIDFKDPNRRNLVVAVSHPEVKKYGRGKKRVVLIDCGVKHGILRSFVARGVEVSRVPWDDDFSKRQFDGLFISNGPGDPRKCRKLVENLRRFMESERSEPVFGICLGMQILAMAAGARMYKLKYGHRSQNQPCLEEGTNRCVLTSQNHGYAVREKSLPSDWSIWYRNLNDQTVEGIRHRSGPWFGVQFHPEASPGPVETKVIFDQFIKML